MTKPSPNKELEILAGWTEEPETPIITVPVSTTIH